MMRNLPIAGALRGSTRVQGERDSRLRYCIECLADCRRDGRAAYCKIRHQLPGTYFCDLHLSPLKAANESLLSGPDVALQLVMRSLDSPVLPNVTSSEANAIKSVAEKNARQLVYGGTRELSDYHDLVHKAGFLMPDGRLRMAALIAEWLTFFGPAYCYLTEICEQKIIGWWNRVSRGANRVVLPSPFIFVAAESLLESIVLGRAAHLPMIPQSSADVLRSKLPKCAGYLHRVSDSYGVARRVRRSQKWEVDCSCGITYRASVKSPDVEAAVRPVAHGERYYEYFHELLVARGNVKSVARELGVSRRVATAWNKTKISSGSDQQQKKRLGRAEIAALRREWRKLVQDASPAERRVTVARLAGTLIYGRLAAHDREWLMEFNRSQSIPRAGRAYSSKNGLTEARLQLVNQAYEQLIQSEPPVRVTGSAILEKVGIRFSVRDNTRWSELLCRLAESRSAYFERVLCWLRELPMSERPRNTGEFERIMRCSWAKLTDEKKSLFKAYFNR